MPKDEIVRLNVGGKQLMTKVSTLAKVPELVQAVQKEEQPCFLDRDPRAFELLLKSLRGYTLESHEQAAAQAEADYWAGDAPNASLAVMAKVEKRGEPQQLYFDAALLRLLPLLRTRIRASIVRCERLPLVALTERELSYVEELQRALVGASALDPFIWHWLKQRFGLTERLPLEQYFELVNFDPYAEEFELTVTCLGVEEQRQHCLYTWLVALGEDELCEYSSTYLTPQLPVEPLERVWKAQPAQEMPRRKGDVTKQRWAWAID